MTRDADRLFPSGDKGNYALNKDGAAEYGTVKDSPDRSVRRLPHLFKVILGHTRRVWCDSSALYRNAVLLCCVRGINSDLIVCLVSLFKSEVIVLGFEVDVGKKEFVLDHLPDDPCHLVAVHLNDGGDHFNLIHQLFSFV